MPYALSPLRRGALAALLALPHTAWVDAATVRVGPDAGSPASACDFRTPQQAIAALPDDGSQHRVELSSDTYTGPDATVDLAGKRVHMLTAYRSGSGCQNPIQPGDDPAALVASQTPLAGGRTVVVRNGGALRLESVRIADNARGAVLVRDATVVLDRVSIQGHRTVVGGAGGGVVLEGGSVEMIDSTFSDNQASSTGGAVFCSRSGVLPGSIVLRGENLFLANSASMGGAIYLFQGCTLALHDFPQFTDNTVALDGGAIATEASAGGVLRNRIEFHGNPEFRGNHAPRNGGAVALTAGNELVSPNPLGHSSFVDNFAQSMGGALHLSGAGPQAVLGSAIFVDNGAGRHGGAVAVAGRQVVITGRCAEEDTQDELYCAQFSGNRVPVNGFTSAGGGSLYLAGGELTVDSYALRDSRGPASNGSDRGGVIARVDTGLLRLRNSLVFDHVEQLGSGSVLFELKASSRIELLFNTIVDTPAGTVLVVPAQASAQMAGNIIAGNAAGVVAQGTLSGTCNNAQLGANQAPDDPGFVTTPAGRYRLGAGSAMIDGGLGCDPDRLPAGFQPPLRDLDGRLRRTPGEPALAIDLGAFEFRLEDDRLFGNGFEPLALP